MRTEFEIQLAVATFGGGVNVWRTWEGVFDLICWVALRSGVTLENRLDE